MYDEPWRSRSARYWSPFVVAELAATWLTETGVTTVLDVGSGAGKFCIVGALVTQARFVGVEHRPSLVLAARRAAEHWGVADRTHFLHAEANAALLEDFGAIYLFNPFGENLFETWNRLDSSVELGRHRHIRDVALVEHALHRLAPGARVATYHGFGGYVPDNFDIERERAIGSDVLRLWVKSNRTANGYYAENDEAVTHVPASSHSPHE